MHHTQQTQIAMQLRFVVHQLQYHYQREQLARLADYSSCNTHSHCRVNQAYALTPARPHYSAFNSYQIYLTCTSHVVMFAVLVYVSPCAYIYVHICTHFLHSQSKTSSSILLLTCPLWTHGTGVTGVRYPTYPTPSPGICFSDTPSHCLLARGGEVQ